MPRTAAIAFPFVLALAWYVHVTNRAGDGPGLQWGRIPQNVSYTAALTGTAYALFVLVALIVLYFTRIRGQTNGGALILSALGHLSAAFVVALVLGVALAEVFCLADERAFQRELRAHQAAAQPGKEEMYSRQRWWPANSQALVGPMPGER